MTGAVSKLKYWKAVLINGLPNMFLKCINQTMVQIHCLLIKLFHSCTHHNFCSAEEIDKSKALNAFYYCSWGFSFFLPGKQCCFTFLMKVSKLLSGYKLWLSSVWLKKTHLKSHFSPGLQSILQNVLQKSVFLLCI